MAEIPTPPPTEGRGFSKRNFFKVAAVAAGVGIAIRAGFKAREMLRQVGKEDKVEEIDGTKITYEEFKPEGKEVVDPTKAVIYLTGFPWSAAEKSIHKFPQVLTNSFGMRGFIIDTKRERDDSDSLAKQADSTRKFFKQKGIKEVVLVSQSLGVIKQAYLTVNLETTDDIKVKSVIAANPRGLDKMGKRDLVAKFAKDVFKVGLEEKVRNEQNKIKIVTPEADPKEIQQGFIRSILRNVKYFGWQYAPLLWSQLKTLTEIDPIFKQIKAPVLLFVASKDLVSETEKYIPGQKVVPEHKDTKKEQVDANRIAMTQTTKGRERYLKENIFTSAQEVKVLETSRLGDHLAVPGPRAQQVADISAKYPERSRKITPPKTA